jgi:hypothetical protein
MPRRWVDQGCHLGIYFRLLLIGYFEGIDSERGIAWRAADSLALRDFLGMGLDAAPPDHSTISRTRRLIAVETHRAVFTWILQSLSTAGLVKGNTIGIDATTLEANSALRSIVRRDTGESYEEFLAKLAKASGIGTQGSSGVTPTTALPASATPFQCVAAAVVSRRTERHPPARVARQLRIIAAPSGSRGNL